MRPVVVSLASTLVLVVCALLLVLFVVGKEEYRYDFQEDQHVVVRREADKAYQPGVNCDEMNYEVCGSDGKTYSNLCSLHSISSSSRLSIVVLHEGPCQRGTSRSAFSSPGSSSGSAPSVYSPNSAGWGHTQTLHHLSSLQYAPNYSLLQISDTVPHTLKASATFMDKYSYENPNYKSLVRSRSRPTFSYCWNMEQRTIGECTENGVCPSSDSFLSSNLRSSSTPYSFLSHILNAQNSKRETFLHRAPTQGSISTLMTQSRLPKQLPTGCAYIHSHVLYLAPCCTNTGKTPSPAASDLFVSRNSVQNKPSAAFYRSNDGLLDRSHLMSRPLLPHDDDIDDITGVKSEGGGKTKSNTLFWMNWNHPTIPPLPTHPPSHTNKPWWTTSNGGSSEEKTKYTTTPRPTTSYTTPRTSRSTWWWSSTTTNRPTTTTTKRATTVSTGGSSSKKGSFQASCSSAMTYRSPLQVASSLPEVANEESVPEVKVIDYEEEDASYHFNPWGAAKGMELFGDNKSPRSSMMYNANSSPKDDFRVVGGSIATPHLYPWLAVLFKGSKQFCGGSLIDETHILTAAHCIASLNSYELAQLRIVLGAHNLYSAESTTQQFTVTKVVRHRNYDPARLRNDVAVLTLNKKANINSYVRPICLNSNSKSFVGTFGTVAGWGSLHEGGPQQGILRQVQLVVWDNESCRVKYGSAAPGGVIPSYLCAGKGGRDSCSGDSGGPIVQKVDGVWKQLGIVSWGIGCGKGHYPGVYSRLTYFLPWITEVVQKF